MVDNDPEARRRRGTAIAWMQGIGALLCLLSLLAPGSVPPGAPRTAFLVVIVACTGFCVLALLRRHRLSTFEVAIQLLAGDAAVTAVTVVANTRPGGNSDLLLLLWPTLLAAIFMTRRLVAFQMVAVAVVGAVVYHRAEAGAAVAVVQFLVMFSSLAISAAVVVQLRERLTAALRATEELSRVDPLTGLANRRGLDEQLPGVWGAALRHGETIVVLLLDVDHFKRINDEHGHAVGDLVLADLAVAVRARVRAQDVVARLGGEELVVLATDTLGVAGDIGERLRSGVGESLPVTVSIGCVAHVPSPEDDPHQVFSRLLAKADAAMYEAKRSGRDRVVVADESTPPVRAIGIDDERTAV